MKSSIYNDIINIVDICAERAKNILVMIQEEMKKNMGSDIDGRIIKPKDQCQQLFIDLTKGSYQQEYFHYLDQ